MRFKRKWKEEYDKYDKGQMDEEYKRLESLVETGKSSDEEIIKYNKMKNIKANLTKVKNIIEYKESLKEKQSQYKKEIARFDVLKDVDSENKEIIEEIKELKQKIKAKEVKKARTKGEERKKLREELLSLNDTLIVKENKYFNNQEKFFKSLTYSNPKFIGKSQEQLEAKAIELESKISKCNMACNYLMKGMNWDLIEFKLDNWQENKKYTSKDKVAQKIVESKEEDIESKGIEPEYDLDLEYGEEDRYIFSSSEKEKEYKEETKALTKQSKFLTKHPRIAKIFNFISSKLPGRRHKEDFNIEENLNMEEIGDVNDNKPEEKETKNDNTKVETPNEKPNKDNEFKAYLKAIAEKGMEQAGKEKLATAREARKNNEKIDEEKNDGNEIDE